MRDHRFLNLTEGCPESSMVGSPVLDQVPTSLQQPWLTVAHAQLATLARIELNWGARCVMVAPRIHTLRLRLQRGLIVCVMSATRTSAQATTGHVSRALPALTRPALGMGCVLIVR